MLLVASHVMKSGLGYSTVYLDLLAHDLYFFIFQHVLLNALLQVNNGMGSDTILSIAARASSSVTRGNQDLDHWELTTSSVLEVCLQEMYSLANKQTLISCWVSGGDFSQQAKQVWQKSARLLLGVYNRLALLVCLWNFMTFNPLTPKI